MLDRANGQPVAILQNSTVVGYLVPAEAVGRTDHRDATLDAVMDSMARRRAINQPVLDDLTDK